MTSKNFPLSRRKNTVEQDLNDELLIYDLLTNKTYCLNKTAALIDQSADGRKSISEIVATLSRKLKSNVSEEFVLYTLNELKINNLLEGSGFQTRAINSQSRRETIKRIGLSTAVALPMISMLVAPKAAHAQSAGACSTIGQLCVPPDDPPCCAGLKCGSDNGGRCVDNNCAPQGAFCITDNACCSLLCFVSTCL